MLRDALVVGISSYQYLPALNAPAHDAEAIAHQLELYGDFRVTRLPEIVQSQKLRVGVKTPTNLADLETALVKLFKPKGSNVPHTALFYFSGHGLQKEAGIREGYLATSDANPNAHFYGLSLFWLRRLLQESPVRQRIVLLDCCHSGEILNYLEADPGAKTGTDRLFMAASREYESAYESLDGNYSVFTQALLDGIDPRRLAGGMITNYALTDWVSNALKGESQQPLFENSGSEIVLTRCQNPSVVLHSPLAEDVCPYRGLEPFEEGHAEYFFGRENLTDQLVNRLRTGNFLAVIGASGSGKSSLVRAGLGHKLQRGHALSGSDRWQIRIMTPTEHPFKSMANAFVNPDALPLDRAEQLRRAEMLLQEGGSGLTHLIRASLMSEAKNTRLVLIIDQFEEVFTLCQGQQTEHDRHRFFNCLLLALRELGDRFNLVIVLRADFLSKCSFYKELSEQIEHNLVMVTPLSYEQIKASILKPAEKVGLVCEPNLVYNILLDIVGAPGELPLLQYTLLELWQQRQRNAGEPARLTLDTYAELGGVRGTLQKRADEIFYSLTGEEQKIAKRIFIALTQLGEGTEDTRRRVLKSELVTPQFSAQLVEQVLEKLVVAKLVVTNQVVPASCHQERIDQQFANVSTALRLAQVVRHRSAQSPQDVTVCRSLPSMQSKLSQGYNLSVARLSHSGDLNSIQPASEASCHETVDIAHEALIRNWALLRSWLDENREMLRRQRQIERVARDWNAVDRPRSTEFLLHGSRLIDAEDFLSHYPNELSALAQQHIVASREENHRTRREMRLLQVSVPCTLMAALGITFIQYQVATKSQVEKDFQLQVATSRQWSAIAQSILQEPDGDPNTALLISRLAAERGKTYEAEASLRTALQKLRLQATLQTRDEAIQVKFSPSHDRVATLSSDGTIRLWSLANLQPLQTWQWHDDAPDRTTNITKPSFYFDQNGDYLLAVAKAAEIRVWSTKSGELRHRLGGFEGAIAHVTVSLDGKLVAASSGDAIKVWDIASGELQAAWTQPGVHGLKFNADGTGVLVVEEQSAALVPLVKPRPKQILSQVGAISSAAFSPDRQWIATVDERGNVRLWNANTGRLRQTMALSSKHQPDSALQVNPEAIFSPDGQHLAIIQASGQVSVVHLQSERQWSIERDAKSTKDNPQVAIAFSPDGQKLVVSETQPFQETGNSIASIREVATGQEIDKLQGHTGNINAIQFNNDGSLIATASVDGSVRLWAGEQGGEFPSLKLTPNPIQWMAFQPPATALKLNRANTVTQASDEILAIGDEGRLHQWEFVQRTIAPTALASHSPNAEPQFAVLAQAGQALNQLQQLRNSIQLFPTHPKEKQNSPVETAKTAQPVTVIKTLTTLNPITEATLNTRLTSAAFGQNGMVATANNTGTVEVWQMQPNQSVNRVRQLQSIAATSQNDATNQVAAKTIHQLAFSNDGQKLVGVGVDRHLRLWDVASGQLLHQLSGHEAIVEQARFSLDGKQIISASWDRTVRIWNVQSGALVTTLTHSDVITSAQFSPDSRRVFMTSLDGTARVVDAASGALQVILTGHRGALLDGDFSPDGQLLVTASADGTARIWDASTGVEQAILRPTKVGGVQEPIKRVFFNQDGQYIGTLSSTGTLHLWAATWQGLVKLAHDRSLRQLKSEECLRYLRLAPTACPSLSLNDSL